MSITRLPIEVVSFIVREIDLEDQLNLSLSCRHFQYIIFDEGICRLSLLDQARHSTEFRNATRTGEYARALRRLVKRRVATQSARPYCAAVIGVADSFVYKNGALLYTVKQHHMRILLLRDNVKYEFAINTYKLMREAIPESDVTWDFRLTPVHYEEGMASCVLQHPQTEALQHWLVCWDVESSTVLARERLDTIESIFVRNNGSYLYYGVRTPAHADGGGDVTDAGFGFGFGFGGSSENDSVWEIRGLDLKNNTTLPHEFRLPEWVGEDIGRTSSFEIFDGWLYGISNEQAFRPELNKWDSFYYAFRFKMGAQATMQVLPRKLSWRRGSNEGPVDDRWYTLQLVRDEGSSEILVYETRREWKPESGQNRRSCYHKKLAFPPITGEDSEDEEEDEKNGDHYLSGRPLGTTHLGDSSLEPLTFNHYQTHLRSYGPSSGCFVDLVNDSRDSDSQTQRLRLRVRSRTQVMGPRAARERDAPTVSFWPAPPKPERFDQNDLEQGHYDDEDSPFMQHVYRIMNPWSSTGRLHCQADEHCIIYSPEGAQGDRPRPLVLLSFDSGLRLFGLRKPWQQQEHDPFDSLKDSMNDNDIPLELVQKSCVADLHDKGWSSRVQPYYLLVNENRPYGYDLSGR